MKLYEQLLNEIKDGEITRNFQRIFESSQSNGIFSLEEVSELCRVFNDEVHDYGLFYSMIHAIERTYPSDKEAFVEAVVKGFSLNKNECQEWCQTVLVRLKNSGLLGSIIKCIGNLEEQTPNFNKFISFCEEK